MDTWPLTHGKITWLQTPKLIPPLRPGSVSMQGTVYEKTNAEVEMKKINREEFWEQAKVRAEEKVVTARTKKKGGGEGRRRGES